MNIIRWVGLMVVVVGLIWGGLPESVRAQNPTHDEIWRLTWSPDGEQIAVGFWNGRLELRSAGNQLQSTALTGHTYGITALAWRPDGLQLVSGSSRELFVWDTSNGQLLVDLNDKNGSPDSILAVSWNLDSSQIYVFRFDQPGDDRQIWDAKSYTLIDEKPDSQVTDIAWDASRTHVMTGTMGGGITLRDPMTFQELVYANENGVAAIALSLGGQRMALGTWNSGISVWNVPASQTNTEPPILLDDSTTLRNSWGKPDFPLTYILAMSYSFLGNRVYSVSGSGELAAWDANNGALISTTHLENTPITAAAFNQLGTKLAYGDANGELHMVDVATLVPPETFGALPTFFRISDGQAASRLLQ